MLIHKCEIVTWNAQKNIQFIYNHAVDVRTKISHFTALIVVTKVFCMQTY